MEPRHPAGDVLCVSPLPLPGYTLILYTTKPNGAIIRCDVMYTKYRLRYQLKRNVRNKVKLKGHLINMQLFIRSL